MANLWYGSIKTDGDYATLASISGVTFTADKTYTIQVKGKCYLCEKSSKPTSGGFLVTEGMPVQYTAGTGSLYVKNISDFCTINIAD